MNRLIPVLVLTLTSAQAETGLPSKPLALLGDTQMILSDTQCLMQTVPGFDAQVLTPRQVARLQAVMVHGDASGLPRGQSRNDVILP